MSYWILAQYAFHFDMTSAVEYERQTWTEFWIVTAVLQSRHIAAFSMLRICKLVVSECLAGVKDIRTFIPR
jgi:hypothetical protein